MKILITGSNGFLGYNLTNYFSKKKNRKFEITASYNLKKPKFKRKGIKIIKLNSTTLKRKSKKLNFNVVIHCASKTRVNTRNNIDLYKENIEFLNQILKKINFDHFFFMSSMSVYGHIKDKKINENTSLAAKDYYGKSKIECENRLRKFSLKNIKKKIVIFRLPGVVGFNSHSNFMSNLKNSFQKNLNNTLTINNKNDKFNNILHVKDLYFFIKKLLSFKYNSSFIIFVLGSKYAIQLKNIIKIFEIYYKKTIEFKFIKTNQKNKLIDFNKGRRFGFKFNSTIKSIMLMLKDH